MLNIRMQSQDTRLRPKITVIGVGGAGGNAVNNMISSGLKGCEFLVCNTDAQALETSIAEQKIQLGPNVTRGLGAGATPEIGAAAAEETIEEILGHLEGANMVFVTAGMGGGTGTGAAPVIARAAREKGVLTVGVVTKPFHFEGTHRMKLAESGIEDMQHYVDTLIVIPNQNLFRIANEKTTFADAFCMADEVLQSGVRGVTDLMVQSGLINLDFADIRSVMAEMGKAMMGTGESEGDRRALEAAEAAISNPLLDDISMKGAKGILINITGGLDMTLFEVDEAANRIRDEVDPEANIIFGSTFDDNMEGKMRVSVVATGIDAEAQKKVFVDNSNRAAKMQNFIKKPIQTEEIVDKAYTDSSNVVEQDGSVSMNASVQYGNEQPQVQKANNPLTNGFRNDLPKIPNSIIPQANPNQYVHASQSQQPITGTAPGAPKIPNAPKKQPETEQQVGYAETTQEWSQGGTATARKISEDEMDLSAMQTQSKTPHMNTPVSQKRDTRREEWQQPQAQRYGNTFIPPRPMDARMAETAEQDGTFVEEAATAQRNPITTPSSQMPSPQVQVQPQPVAKRYEEEKKPSFFERLTGQKKPEPVKNETSVKKDDEELDIPAFLRRQAN